MTIYTKFKHLKIMKHKNFYFLLLIYLISAINKFNLTNYEVLNNDDAFEYIVAYSPNFDWFMLIAQRSVGFSGLVFLLSKLGLSTKLIIFLSSTLWGILVPFIAFNYLIKRQVNLYVALFTAFLIGISPSLGIYSIHLKNYPLEAFAMVRVLSVYSFPRKKNILDNFEKILWIFIVGAAIIPIALLEIYSFIKSKNIKYFLTGLSVIILMLYFIIIPALFDGGFIEFYQASTFDLRGEFINNGFLALMFLRSFYDGGFIAIFTILFFISLFTLVRDFTKNAIPLLSLSSFVLLFVLGIYPFGTLKGDVILTPLIFIIIAIGIDKVNFNKYIKNSILFFLLITGMAAHLTAPLTAVQDSKESFKILQNDDSEFSLFVDLSYASPTIVYLNERVEFYKPSDTYINAWGENYCLYGGKDEKTIFGSCLYQEKIPDLINQYIFKNNPETIYFLFENQKLRFIYQESESSITIDQLDVIMKNNNYVKDLFLEKTNSTLVKYNINN